MVSYKHTIWTIFGDPSTIIGGVGCFTYGHISCGKFISFALNGYYFFLFMIL